MPYATQYASQPLTRCYEIYRTMFDTRIGRPKAHTGRSTAKKTASKSAPTKKATTGKVGGRKPATKAKAKAKPKAKAKAKPKPKPKPKKKAPSASALRIQGVAQRKELKETALLEEPPKLPENAWVVYFVQNKPSKGAKPSETPQHTRDVAAAYKELSPLERERLNHTANENKATNKKNYADWLSKYNPIQIKQANAARKKLAKQASTSSSKKIRVVLIKDDRIVKRPRTSFTFYNVERRTSGDFKHLTLGEAAGLIGREWKELSPSAKKQYEDQASQDRARYAEEYKSVYGVDVPSLSKK